MSKNSRTNEQRKQQAMHDLRAPFAVIKHYLKRENFLNDSVFTSAFERFELLIREISHSDFRPQVKTAHTKRSVQ